MLTSANLARRIYAVFLRLYPSGFREAFAEEMRAVFAEAAAEARGRGILAFGRMAVREMRGLLVGALREHWQVLSRKELIMSETLEINGGAGAAKAELRGGYDPESWKNTLLAGLPHLLMGCFFATLSIITAYEFASSRENLADVIGIALAVIFAILVD